jgi:hypothetical protein
MSFLTREINTRQLKQIPFNDLYQLVEDQVAVALELATTNLEDKFQQQVMLAEQHYSLNQEAPTEVSFADQIAKPELSSEQKSEIRRKITQETIKDVWIAKHKLKPVLVALMPQVMVWLQHKHVILAEVCTAEGQIDGRKMLNHIFDFSSEWDRGLYQFLMLDARSAYLSTQYKGESKPYCALVPLIPYAFKLYRSTPYSKWDKATLKWVVNSSLCDAMTLEPKEFTRQDLLVARDRGLTIMSGEKEGSKRNPMTTHRLWSTKDTVLEGLPELAQVMLAQIWCAHPSNRTNGMVLDPYNWDQMPTPLITEDIFNMKPVITKKLKVDTSNDLPWNV